MCTRGKAPTTPRVGQGPCAQLLTGQAKMPGDKISQEGGPRARFKVQQTLQFKFKS